MISVYQFAVNNTKAHIRSDANRQMIETLNPDAMTAFKAAEILAIAFMKDRNEVLAALIAS